MDSEWTLDAANVAAGALKAAGISDVEVRYHDRVEGGEVVKAYYIKAVIRDYRTGNVVLREFRAPADLAKPATVAKEMTREAKGRAKATRSRIAAEKKAT